MMNWNGMGIIEENIPREKPLRCDVADWRWFVRRSTCVVGWDKREDAMVVGLAAEEEEEEEETLVVRVARLLERKRGRDGEARKMKAREEGRSKRTKPLKQRIRAR